MFLSVHERPDPSTLTSASQDQVPSCTHVPLAINRLTWTYDLTAVHTELELLSIDSAVTAGLHHLGALVRC